MSAYRELDPMVKHRTLKHITWVGTTGMLPP